VTVTSQQRPSGLFPSVRNNPDGSFVTGVPAEALLLFFIIYDLRAVTFSVINSRMLRAFQEAVRKKQSCFVNRQHIEIHIANQIESNCRTDNASAQCRSCRKKLQ